MSTRPKLRRAQTALKKLRRHIYEEMSESDRLCAFHHLDLNTSTVREERAWLNAMQRAYKLLNRRSGPLWPALLQEARSLIAASRSSRLMAIEHCGETVST